MFQSKKNWPLETLIQIIFVFNSINFCFWAKKGENKWTVNIGNEQLGGSIALFRCIEKEVERNTDFLTGDELADFEDYKIPQILRNLEIIEYSLPLSSKIDSFELIESGSREEIEIRVATVWAVELVKRELQKKFDFVTASHVDNILWNMSQTKTKGEKPYHRTLTIASFSSSKAKIGFPKTAAAPISNVPLLPI